MKKKFLMHVLALVLACSAVCFVGCNAKKDPVTSSDDGPIAVGPHTHTYEPVAREESTCVTHGHEAYYVCDGCDTIFVKDGDIYEEADLDSLELPLGAHKFNGITLDTANVTTEYVAFEVFDESGLKVTKTCSVEGCAGVKVADLDVEIAYPVEGATCLTAAMDHVIVKVGDYSANLNVTVSKKVIALPEIAGKPATGSVQVADVAASDYYEVTTNNGGETAGLYDVVLTVKDTVNCTFKVDGVESATATVKFEILKGANTITMPASIAPVMCHNEPEVAATALENPEFTKLYSDTADGEFYPITSFGDGLSAGTWYVKVKAAETASFGETLSDAVSFNVAHKFGGYKKGENEDVPVCACGEEINGDSFKTLVTDTNYVLATAEGFATDMAKLTFGGASEFISVDAITCGDLELGTVTVPNMVNAATLISGTHGAKTFNIEVTDKDDYAHILTVPVVLVTEYINDWSTLLYKTQMHNGRQPEDCIFGAGEYYVLSDDITATGRTSGFTYNGATYGAKDYSSWNYKASSYEDSKGFSGTVDGAGHTIKNVIVGYCGIFASLKDGTIKNLNIEVDTFDSDSGVIANHAGGAIIENVNIIVKNAFDCYTLNSGNWGIIFRQHAFKTTVKNVNIYAPGSKIKYAIAQGHWAGVSAGSNTYTNVKCYAESVERWTMNNATIETCEAIETVEKGNGRTQYVQSSQENFVIGKPAVLSDYIVAKVVLNGEVIADNDTINTKFILGKLNAEGDNSMLVTLVKDGHTIILPCSVETVSRVITEWNELLYYVQYRSGKDDEFAKGEYYVLGNDIVGDNPTYPNYNGESWTPDSPYEDAQGFAGTLDGAGYTISNIDFTEYSIFGEINGGTIKNLNLEGTLHYWAHSLFGGSGNIHGANVENVNIKLVPGTKDDELYTDFTSWNDGLIGASQIYDSKFTNLTIHAEGMKFKYLLNQGYYGYYGGTTWTNCKIYAADFLYWSQTTIDPKEGVTFYMDRQTITLEGETVAVKLPTAWSGSSIGAFVVTINGVQMPVSTAEDAKKGTFWGAEQTEVNIAALPVATILEAIGNQSGDYEITFALSANGWTWAYRCYIPVHFEVPETNVEPDQGTEEPDAGAETPSGGDESAAAGTEE